MGLLYLPNLPLKSTIHVGKYTIFHGWYDSGAVNQPFNPSQRWKKIDPRSGDDIIEADIDAKTTGHEEVICTFLKLMVMRLHWIIQRLGL